MNVTTATPAQIDTQLAELGAHAEKLAIALRRALDSVHQANGERMVYMGRSRVYRATDEEALDTLTGKLRNGELESWDIESAKRALRTVETLRAQLDENYDRQAPLNAEYRRRRWTRAFLCTSDGGHVHASQSCSSLRMSTGLVWVITTEVDGDEVEVSGLTEAQIIELAGEGACTKCYPNAPVTDRESRIFDPKTRAEKLALAAERDAKRAEKIAKGVTSDGSPLHLRVAGMGVDIKTERAAELRIVEFSADLARAEKLIKRDSGSTEEWAVKFIARKTDDARSYRAAIALITEALAWKRNTTPEAITELLAPKVAKKIAAAY